MKFVWPPVTRAMQERQKKIAEGLDAAGRAQRDLSLAQEKATQTLRETKEQAAQILEEAKEQARSEGERLIAAAKAEIEQEMNRAKDQLRAQVAALAVKGAEQILESEVDSAAHSELVNKLASQL